MKSPLEEDLFPFARDRVKEVSDLVDPADLLSLLREREKDAQVAAELGKTLLTEIQDLKRENDRLEEEYSQKLEELEQEKYTSRMKYEMRESEWEARVAELEGDVQRLQLELQKQQQYVREVEKVKVDMECDLSEQNQKLMEQLREATKAEQTLAQEIQALRGMFMGKKLLLTDNATRAQSLQAEITLLSEQKHNLEQRMVAMEKENLSLKSSHDSIQEQCLQLQQKNQEWASQLTMSQEDYKEVQALNRQLKSRLQELSEQQTMQESTSCNTSLLSEIEQSLESEAWETEKDQIRTEIEKLHQELLTLMGTDRSGSLTGSQTPSLQAALLHLKDLVYNLVHGSAIPVHLEDDPKGLEEKLKWQQQQFQQEKALNKEKQQMIEELQKQVQLQSADLMKLRKENDSLRCSLENSSDHQPLQQAIRERDTAIAKKNAMEVELAKCQRDMKLLNSQLLETIQQKVDLSQELEAWQDDMQFIINQQLRNQQQAEQTWPASAENPSESSDSKHHSFFLRRTRSQIPEGKSFLSLFKR
ncbi:BICD family-like cargo adapter 1 isoform X1 [Hemitrygon akajei]|uniref:BICD family-like cargo adapter 1 isoform X1 n=2 Tax=Hemitrygon akajei TaxID=2704970 RepID=UPI003BF9A243